VFFNCNGCAGLGNAGNDRRKFPTLTIEQGNRVPLFKPQHPRRVVRSICG